MQRRVTPRQSAHLKQLYDERPVPYGQCSDCFEHEQDIMAAADSRIPESS